MTITINEAYRNENYTSQVIQFYIIREEVTEKIYETFSYIYNSETDEIEFSFEVDATVNNFSVPIYYTVNEREISIKKYGILEPDRNLAATLDFSNGVSTSTVIARIPAFKKLIREVYEDNKSSLGLIIPEDYNPTLGSNWYKDSNDNSYVTRDTYEDYLRSSNIKGHTLDEVGRKQIQESGYYKIIKTLRIKCNALEKSIDTDGNYYSADRSVIGYIISGIYTYDLYDHKKNLIREDVIETTPNITFYNISKGELVIEEDPLNRDRKRPALGVLPVPPEEIKSFNYIYAGRLFYEDFDGILRFVQSTNYVRLERFVAADFGETEGTPTYWEGGYPLYIIGPNRGDYISFTVQLDKEDEENYPSIGNFSGNIISTFSNPEYQRLFDKLITYDPENGKLTVTISAKYTNDEDDPWRPSYAKILPSLEVTNIRIMINPLTTSTELNLAYYVIQKSSKIGIIPKKYLSKESTDPIDLERRQNDGKYILPIVGGIGVKTAYVGITSEVDPYDKEIVRSWMIRENMNYTDVNGTLQPTERSYFFEKYSGEFEEKIMLITGAYDGELPEFYVRDFINKSDIWRRAIYESEVTIIPIVENTDKTVDLGGGWSYTLDTATNYFIGSHLLYLFNETNKYYTQKFNLIFQTPPNTGPNYNNFRATINDVNLFGSHSNGESFTDDDGLTYTYYDNYNSIYTKLFGDSETLVKIIDEGEEIEIKHDDSHVTATRMKSGGNDLFIKIVHDPNNSGDYSMGPNVLENIYHCVTTNRTEFPAFYIDEGGNYVRLKSRGGQPLFISVTETSNLENQMFGVQGEGGIMVYPQVATLATLQADQNLEGLDIPNIAFPAFEINRYPFVDKYKSLLEIKNSGSNKKIIYFAFEDINITDKTVKFDILYPITKKIDTKDIERIPTQSVLRFAFRLIETAANYEYQEIQFYCGLEGIRPLELLGSYGDRRYPDPNLGLENLGYPEVELPETSNKFEVISETYSEIFPDWEVVSANNTFDYSAPEGNKIVIIEEEDAPIFEEGNSYLQIDRKNELGGTDFIDLIRTKEGETNWWNDWRFFIYNKFTNRFSLYCSSGSSEMIILDSNNKEVKEVTLSRIGLYRFHISDRTGDGQKRLSIIQTNSKINLYTTTITGENAYGLTAGVVDYDKLLQGHTSRGEKIGTTEPISLKTYSTSSGSIPSQTIYLWYDGCVNGQGTKGRLEFQLVVGSGENEKTYSKSIILTQLPGGNINDPSIKETVDAFFDFESYRMTSPNSETASEQFIGRKFPIEGAQYGFPIFNNIPGRITLTNSNSEIYPYKLKLTVKGEENFIEVKETCTVDSPLTSSSETLVEENCYIVGSFVNTVYELKPITYGKNGDEIFNQRRIFWELIFTSSSNYSKVSTLFYDSPIDTSKFYLESPGSIGRASQSIRGASSTETFKVNAGHELGMNNINDPSNNNTFFYRFTPNNNQTLNYPAIPNDRIIIDSSDPVQLEFVKKAELSSLTLSDIDYKNVDINNILYLKKTNSDIYKSFKWDIISDNSINLQLFSDSDSGGTDKYTNIPLELLNMFTDIQENEDARTVGWINTAILKFNLKIKPPVGMDEEDYNKMITNSNNRESSYYGIGQQFINKITLKDTIKTIQPSTDDGRKYENKENPTFIIPRGKFSMSSNNHVIELRCINPLAEEEYLSYNPGGNLFSSFKLYEKGSPDDPIEYEIDLNGDTIAIEFTHNLSKDVVLEPLFTNIEYTCLKDFIRATSSASPDHYKVNCLMKDDNSNNLIPKNNDYNYPTEFTDFENFSGLRIVASKQGPNNNAVLTEQGKLFYGGHGINNRLKSICAGFPITLEITVDNKSEILELTREGYGDFIFIQAGKNFWYTYVIPSIEREGVDKIWFKKIWFSFYNSQADPEINQNINQGDDNTPGFHLKTTPPSSPNYDTRAVFILFPRRKNNNENIYNIGLGDKGRGRNQYQGGINENSMYNEENFVLISRGYYDIYAKQFQYEPMYEVRENLEIEDYIAVAEKASRYEGIASLYPTVDLGEWVEQLNGGELNNISRPVVMNPYAGYGNNLGSKNIIEDTQKKTKYILKFCESSLDP